MCDIQVLTCQKLTNAQGTVLTQTDDGSHKSFNTNYLRYLIRPQALSVGQAVAITPDHART